MRRLARSFRPCCCRGHVATTHCRRRAACPKPAPCRQPARLTVQVPPFLGEVQLRDDPLRPRCVPRATLTSGRRRCIKAHAAASCARPGQIVARRPRSGSSHTPRTCAESLNTYRPAKAQAAYSPYEVCSNPPRLRPCCCLAAISNTFSNPRSAARTARPSASSARHVGRSCFDDRWTIDHKMLDD